MKNRIAVSLGLHDSRSCLAALRELEDRVGLAEIRLDLMGSFDLARLVAEAPCPLIITCRPPREGGRFAGGEAERLALLRSAADLGAAFVDVEWDALDAFGPPPEGTGLIASRHWHGGMPDDLLLAYRALAERADVVKLVAAAKRAADVVPVLRLLARSETPVIALAMGEAGAATRLLAPCFESCFLTYGAAGPGSATAPGQPTVAEMIDVYGLDRVGAHTRGHLHLCATAEEAAAVRGRQSAAASGEDLHVALLTGSEDLAATRLPGITIVEEPRFRELREVA